MPKANQRTGGDGPEDDGVAVVGISCRFPGAPHPEAFWKLLSEGTSAIREAPEGRGETAEADDAGPGRPGGYLDQVDMFDHDFFRISPREATAMDPQQRLMLELAWEAVEDAGIVPARLHGLSTGVFVGAMQDDYSALVHRHAPTAVTQHTLTGTSRGVIANRISYVLGLRGPSLIVDTGQSSSLVAVHLACESLRRGESETALAGGVHLNLLVASTLRVDRFGGLSPDGRCHTFDAAANGFVRGEGGALVLLKPMRRALADGDRVYCVIRGSAVNNDGAGDGLTVPDPDSQRELVQAACCQAGIPPSALQYVELHGTGTRVGDPVEAVALGTAVGATKPVGRPLVVGSVKTNIGHLESGAGIAGLVKSALSIHHRRLPASLNFRRPNPAIPLDELNLRVVAELEPWPEAEQPLLAGVSSFGMGGTNCHVVLAEPASDAAPPRPAAPAEVVAGRGVLPWTVSGDSEGALRAQAARLLASVEADPNVRPVHVGYSLATARTAFTHRAAAVGSRPEDLLAAVRALTTGCPSKNLVRGVARPRKVVFLFPGQGSQWADMARGLLESSPAFARELHACADALAPHTDWSLLQLLRNEGEAPAWLDRAEVVQPALFAVMVSLAAMWRAAGVEPDAVAGQSQGEIAAAYVAGGLTLEDAARLVAVRAQAMPALEGRGGLLSLPLPAAEAERLLQPWTGRLGIAGLNGPSSTVVSGDTDALEALQAAAADDGIDARRVAIGYASHSAHVEAIRERLLTSLAGIAPRSAPVPLYSTVTAARLDTAVMDPGHWYRNLRRPVLLDPTVRAMLADGHSAFIEVSPHPVLTGGVQDTVEDAGPRSAAAGSDGTSPGAVVLGTLRRGSGGPDRFLTALAHAHTLGVTVDWEAVHAGTGARTVPLPTYAFQRERHWPAQDPGAVRAVKAPPADAQTSRAVRTVLPPEERPLPQRLSELPAGEALRQLTEAVREQVADILGRPDGQSVDATRPFKDLGFDSLSTNELHSRLAELTGLRVPSTLAYNHPTCDALTARLHALLREHAPARAASETVSRLDALEASLTAVPPDGEDLATLETRLSRLLDRLHSPRRHRTQDLAKTIQSATPEEIIDLIDSRGQL